MALIVLTEDISVKKGWVTGRSFDWERPTITAISTNLGRRDWFVRADDMGQRSNLAMLKGKRKAAKADA